MPAYNPPEIPLILTCKHWGSNKDIDPKLRASSPCNDALGKLEKTYARVDFKKLNAFLNVTIPWAKYDFIRWGRECDDLCKELIVSGVMDLRVAIKNAGLAAAATEKKADKKDKDSVALLKKMTREADDFIKEFRPEDIEKLIRAKESEVNAGMRALASRPGDAVRQLLAKARTAAAALVKHPDAAVFNKTLGSGSAGLVQALAQAAALMAQIPDKGIPYEGAGAAGNIAKTLAAIKPLPAGAPAADVTKALKTVLATLAEAAKLPKLKAF
ncbi:MAG: hypothetical protein LBM92_08890 [Opitutaceae bacterium]|jgi:hypothetical protein|nr:hypothetical protein [Opitutaceae bacterium]